MALRNLKTDISSKIEAKAYKEITDILQAKKYHLIKINKPSYSEKMNRSIQKAIKKQMGKKKGEKFIEGALKEELTNQRIGASFLKIKNQFTGTKKINGIEYKEHQGIPKIPGGYLDTTVSKGNNWVFLVPPTGGYKNFMKEINNAVYKDWAPTKLNSRRISLTESGAPDQTPESPTKNDTIEGSHGDFTAWAAFIELEGNKIQPKFEGSVEEFNIAKELVDALDLDFDEKTTMKNGIPSQERIVTIELGKTNVTKRLDAKNKENLFAALNEVIRKADSMGEKGAEAATSVPFRELAASAAQYKIMQEAIAKSKKAGIKVKAPKLKKPKITPSRSVSIKKPKATKRKTLKVSIPEKITVAKLVSKEKGKGKQASTDIAMSLVALKGKINRRLGAEVRRNMGGNRLTNRTGIFSNSAKLLNLRHTKKGISGEYTYMLTGGGISKGSRRGVYSTFENAGRWRTSYNPKPLISKSIQNLALQIAETRFVSLRRT